ncbi:type I-F CRISPR-associated protein Csy1 [Serratia rubidaea]|nr:type I-F CRISPR-associated protein Csy1 [Serratia rubidaea]
MGHDGLVQSIIAYVDSRRQPKLEAFDKDTEKKLAGLSDALEIAAVRQRAAEQRRELEQRYEVRNWLTDAAKKSWQIKFATHAPKYSHGDSKSCGILSKSVCLENQNYMSSVCINNPVVDAIGNAAVFDVVKLLLQKIDGMALIDFLEKDDSSVFRAFSNDEDLVHEWMSCFKNMLRNDELKSHFLSKQLYFPIGDNQYHLLSPLFSSSLAQALHQRLAQARFSEQAKAISAAVRAGKWHAETRVMYPNLAVQSMGGTKPQNISYLNSTRGGRNWLLNCAAPQWLTQSKPPLKHTSIFYRSSEFSAIARDAVRQLRAYLLSVQPRDSTMEIRQRRAAGVDEVIDMLFSYAAGLQNLEAQAGWSAEAECRLKRSQQLWLDPLRGRVDPDFRAEREAGDWQREIALDFGVWLNRQLEHEQMLFSEVERREWSTAPLFKQRLREFEAEWAEAAL